MGMRIESYAYSAGPGGVVGSTDAVPLCVVNTLGALYGAESDYAVLAEPMRFSAALAQWQALLNAATSNTYAFSYSNGTLTLEGAGAWRPILTSAMCGYLGIATPVGTATTWIGTNPNGVLELSSANVKPIQDAARVLSEEFRGGRARTNAWGNFQAFRVPIVVRAARVATLEAGWCTTGRVRVIQGDGGGFDTAWTAGNPTGYVDGYVIQATNWRAAGPREAYWTLELLIGVAR